MKDVKLTNEEIARVFAMYWNGECIVEGLNVSYSVQTVLLVAKNIPSQYKLKNIPLSKITDEHAIELAKISGYEKANKVVRQGCRVLVAEKISKKYQQASSEFLEIDTVTGQIAWDDNIPYEGSRFPVTPIVYDYLKQKGYAVPLFFGIDHPANSKTAIECGIAVDATEK